MKVSWWNWVSKQLCFRKVIYETFTSKPIRRRSAGVGERAKWLVGRFSRAFYWSNDAVKEMVSDSIALLTKKCRISLTWAKNDLWLPKMTKSVNAETGPTAGQRSRIRDGRVLWNSLLKSTSASRNCSRGSRMWNFYCTSDAAGTLMLLAVFLHRCQKVLLPVRCRPEAHESRHYPALTQMGLPESNYRWNLSSSSEGGQRSAVLDSSESFKSGRHNGLQRMQPFDLLFVMKWMERDGSSGSWARQIIKQCAAFIGLYYTHAHRHTHVYISTYSV